MPKTYERDGVSLQYPDNWTVEAEDRPDGWTVTIQSPATAFFMLGIHREADQPDALADEALASMKELYKDLEPTEVQDTLAKCPAIGYDIDFISLDLTNTCLIRSVALAEGCLLLMCQCTDSELALNGRVMEAMRASLTIED